MSRSGYSDDCENVQMYRGVVASATRGKRGQAFFRELLAALDSMPAKRLVAGTLETPEGEVCALGSLARKKGAPLEPDDTRNYKKLSETFNIATQLARETMYENDDGGTYSGETPEERWTRVRKWAAEQIRLRPDELLPAEQTP